MDNRKLLLQIIENVERRRNRFDNQIEKFYEAAKNNKYLCLFGAGMVLSEVVSYLRQKGIDIDFVCDNNPEKHGKLFCGIKCISYEELKKIKKDTVVFISTAYFVEIEKQLELDGFHDYFTFFERFLPVFDVKEIFNIGKDDIVAAFDHLEDEKSRDLYLACILHASDSLFYTMFRNLPFSDNHYFDEELVSFDEDEVLIDAGAYDGADSIRFVNITKEKFNKIYCFELSANNYNLLCNNISKLDSLVSERIICVNKAVSDVNGTFAYDDAESGSKITGGGGMGILLNVSNWMILWLVNM